ncbi:MAG: phenylacetate--CoA ligase family protein [candidate division Zixibacteria bacterium]|nr:phenylacetate--CoA ligase family protein [candidate division Zixibacteria bacterium]
MSNKTLDHPTFIDKFRYLALGPRDLLLKIICSSYSSFLWGFEKLSPRYMEWTSNIRARRAFSQAYRRVPAYRDLIKKSNLQGKIIPETDKKNYIDKYPPHERCAGGIIPHKHIMIDESSGSTGTPYNWIRSLKERHDSHLFISYFASYCYGRKPWITINAFSMGAWATGLNMGIALQQNSIVKNTGPDIEKILHTMKYLGEGYTYVILGYPPFLKHLLDFAVRKNFPIHRYNMDALVGGEGMSEGLRDYLLHSFKRVYSGYGATDLEIGIAGETPLSVALRRLARENSEVRDVVFGKDSRLPMVFQYNPLMHYIEINEKRELIFTITRSSVLSPRIRYNIHDEGGVARYDEIADQLTSLGINIQNLIPKSVGKQRLRLPFVWVYGRRDSTVSVMGANIYPEDIEQALYSVPELAQITSSYCLSLDESQNNQVRPCFSFEVTDEINDELASKFKKEILSHLTVINADFREGRQEYPDALDPIIKLYPPSHGPFKRDSGKIKQVRLLGLDGKKA